MYTDIHKMTMAFDDGGRHWNDAATSQGTSRTTDKHQKLERGNKRPSSRDFRESMALPTP